MQLLLPERLYFFKKIHLLHYRSILNQLVTWKSHKWRLVTDRQNINIHLNLKKKKKS